MNENRLWSKASRLIGLVVCVLWPPASGQACITRPMTTVGQLCDSTCIIPVVRVEDASKGKGTIKGIDPAAVAAYEKIGATFGWLVQSELGLSFVDGTAVAEHGLLPAFSFKNKPLGQLPDVSNPFGLLFQSDSMTDAGLKELAGLKRLSYLRAAQNTSNRCRAQGTRRLPKSLRSCPAPDRPDRCWPQGTGSPQESQCVHLDQTQVTDAGLKILGGLTNLSSLTLGGTQVTDVGLKELAGLKHLATFNVNFTQVTDTGLKELAAFKNLTVLGLATKHIGDAGLKELAGLKNVTTMFLGDTQVTDVGVKHLAGFHDLSWLVLGGTRVTDAGLKDLARHKKLYWLVLSHTQVTDAGVKELAGLTELTEFFLEGTHVTDAGLKELTGLTRLRSLFLRGTKVTDAGVALLQKACRSVR